MVCKEENVIQEGPHHFRVLRMGWMAERFTESSFWTHEFSVLDHIVGHLGSNVRSGTKVMVLDGRFKFLF